jgi:hypothetical protein
MRIGFDPGDVEAAFDMPTPVMERDAGGGDARLRWQIR